MSAIITSIISNAVKTVPELIAAGKTYREAIGIAVEQAGRKVRAGELIADEALERARQDQERIEATRNKFRD